MKIQVTLSHNQIRITEPNVDDVYYIDQDKDNGRFFITSYKGYSGYQGKGFKNLEQALKYVKTLIKNYFIDRCEPNPEGF